MKTWLTPGGALAAAVVGAAVTLGAGWPALALLSSFFLSSTLLTSGGGRRTAAQVVANGSVATAAALLSGSNPFWRLALAGALAAAAADTWSTEIGRHSSRPPRLITSGRRVERGESGGITWLGSAAGVGGASFISLAAALLGVIAAREVTAVALAGIAGGVGDSLLGATVQARYSCPACGTVGESRRHSCGTPAHLASGRPWMTNDTVNFAATALGALVVAALRVPA